MGSSIHHHPLLSTLLLLLFFSPLLFSYRALSGPISSPSISPNFTAAYLYFIDNSGAFLASQNNTYQARITNSKPESRVFYFVVIHVSTNTIIWSANRNNPISQSSNLRLTNTGLSLYNDSGQPIWSTPQTRTPISSMTLQETGNLVLLDAGNNSLWESFDSPTDTLVVGQRLRVGKSLVSSSSDDDLSETSYDLVVGDSDAVLRWNGWDYWKLSMDPMAFRDTSVAVDYLVMDLTGVYLMGGGGRSVVIRVVLQETGDVSGNSTSSFLRILRLDHNGLFSVVRVSVGDGSSVQEFRGPADSCRIPYVCRSLGVCTNGGSCQCAAAFHVDARSSSGDCVPSDSSLSLPDGTCNGSRSSSSSLNDSYVSLRNDLDYFSNDFTDPVAHDMSLSACQDLCSRNCSCLGVFYNQNSGSCYMIRNYLGSLMTKSSSSRNTNRLGYIKTVVVGIQDADSEKTKSDFPVFAVVLLPSSGVIVITVVATLICLRRRRRRRMWEKSANYKLGRHDSSSSGDISFISIPGLPVRFDYQELVAATEGFKTQIGSGGFGTVYKGTLGDKTEVAVKKITCLGPGGKREFLTEIGVIGKIHHINLVRLKGFCAFKGQRFLVYEYMNRGSLASALFRAEPILGWRERYEIALGTARGLAYLHSGCEHKIIHCDVKPENILLHDNSQVKISDFGLSKLLTQEQSGLFTTMRGTRGYLAPEWLTSSTISDKTDVYSYGMVLLEIIRGKKNSFPQSQSQSSGSDSNRDPNATSSTSGEDSGSRLVYFPLFALEMHEDRRYKELVDPRLTGRVRNEEVERLVRIALCCVQEEPNLRPSMTNVVGMLEGDVPVGEPRIESLHFLRFYGRRFAEASRLGENNSERDEVPLYRQPTTASSSSYNSFSYMSSQQVSGPR